MSDTILTALIAGVVGLVTGAVGSLIAPWVNWGIEKRRKQFENRSELVHQWRDIIANADFDRSLMLKSPFYGSLRPLLSPETLQKIERPSTHIYSVIGGPPIDNHDRTTLLHEVARIERKWKLV